jgi:histidyl-tRNA synthetase
MSSKAKFQAIRGTRDLLPPDTALWNRVEQTAHEVFTSYGYGEIRPPIFEPTELFARGVGGDTDIVSKEMYTFVDRSEKLEPDPSIGSMNVFFQKVRELYKSGEIPIDEQDEAALKIAEDQWKKVDDLLDGGLKSGSAGTEIYKLVLFYDALRLGTRVSLRPEATASVCRAYIEHNMQQLPQPVKLYYMGPMFRRERPQKGRYRQFYQIGAEILGGPDAPAIDAELIEMLMTFFDKCGLQGTELSINSIGHAADNCRRGYVAKLKAELEKVKDKLGADSQRRIETNPLRVLDSKLEHEQPIIATLPRIADHLCDECKAHYAAVKRDLDLRGVAYRENWRLVRGLDYYMRTTFEITAQGLGSQNAVCGGGRYDGLVELLGGPPTKGIGFAIGEDRLILSLQDAKSPSPVTSHQSLSVYIAWMGQNAYATVIRAAKTLRNAGFRVELPATELKFGKALERASKLGSRFALILGDNEIQSGEWTLKNLANAEQQKLTEQALLEYLRKL